MPVELNIAVIHEAVAATMPDAECLVWRDRRLSWAEVTERTRRLANVFVEHGLRADDRPVEPWESAQDHVALYLTNCNEYLEGMIGGYKARVAPFNVNYRYVADEVTSLFEDARPKAVIFHARYAPVLAEVLERLTERPRLLLQVADESNEALDGVVDYDEALAAASPEPPPTAPSPDDLYLVYTGGTTGSPKGVLWRQADFLVSALGVGRPRGREYDSLDELVAAARPGALRALPAPPLMHGAAHWNALSCWIAGGTVVLHSDTTRVDPHDVLATVEREQVSSLLIVGDAFARPMLDAQREAGYDLRSLRHIVSGGALFSSAIKRAWTELVPGLRIVDIVGSSESGRQGVGSGTATGRFAPAATAAVLSDDRTRRLTPGAGEIGWLAQTGRMPRGYLHDPEKTARTFPVIDGTRYVVAGDRARLLADGSIELLGRDSVTINTGGEKVFAEEVEHALKHHPAVVDALVVGRPSERWGQEVVAVVHLDPAAAVDDRELVDACRSHLAGYKVPKDIVRVDAIARSASGKPDYVWALTQASRGPGSTSSTVV